MLSFAHFISPTFTVESLNPFAHKTISLFLFKSQINYSHKIEEFETNVPPLNGHRHRRAISNLKWQTCVYVNFDEIYKPLNCQQMRCNLIYRYEISYEKKRLTIESHAVFKSMSLFSYEIRKDISQNQMHVDSFDVSFFMRNIRNVCIHLKPSNGWQIMIGSINRFNNIVVLDSGKDENSLQKFV